MVISYSHAIIKNCLAGPFSFGSDITNDEITTQLTCIDTISTGGYSFGWRAGSDYGSYTNCQSYNNNSWNVIGSLYGEYINCSSQNYSFRAELDINGYFANCTAGDISFYSNDGSIFSNFNDCKGGVESFYASNSDIYATFLRCIGDSNSFYADGINNGEYYYCMLYDTTFSGGNQEYCLNGL